MYDDKLFLYSSQWFICVYQVKQEAECPLRVDVYFRKSVVSEGPLAGFLPAFWPNAETIIWQCEA